MPYFKVMLVGRGISYPSSNGGDPIIGFFTTRLIKATDETHAQHLAKEAVLAEWRPGGEYASANAGSLPALTVDDSWRVGPLSGIFGRRPRGYAFYRRED